MSDRSAGQAPSRLVAVLGPTNTGKTHLAVERMLGHASGMIGLPLRLLAREIYDRIVKLRGARVVALITGEEKIVPPRAHYFVCTVEAMPLSMEVEFLAVDEIQLAADPERGHVFTHRLLHARGRYETMFLGAGTMAPLIRKLLPDAEIVTRERFSTLSYAGSKKLTRLPRRTAVVAFSANEVYAIAELIRRQRGGAAVVMGSLSPRTRNAQVALYQSGEVDFLVATDAIGMGLNMDVDHVAFAGLKKFDGKRSRFLYPTEVAQIAGRAGRYRTDGTFGVTGDCEDMDEDLVTMVEDHRFEPITQIEWRNANLDFANLGELLRSLSAPTPHAGLKASEEALDETTLRKMAGDAAVVDRCKDRSALFRLWDVCQTPDFRKTTFEDHVRLVGDLFDFLTRGRRRVPDDWIDSLFKQLDRTDGEIDALSTRLAGVRTLAYAAARSDWLTDPAHWQATTRGLEDRLSDTLHEKLMARFIDRRTSALMRGLRVSDEILAGVSNDGSVTVEGHFVGKLQGLRFDMAHGAGVLEEKTLRAAAQRAVGPEIARRLGRLAAEPDDAFSVASNGVVLWRGEAAAVLTGDRPFAPRLRLYGELGPETARERAARRLEAFVAAESGRQIGALRRLETALRDGRLTGLPRGLAYRLIESGGVLPRREAEADIKALSQSERRAMRSLGVRIGAFSLYMPSLLTERARSYAEAFAAQLAPGWRPALVGLSHLPSPAPPKRALALRGLLAVGPFAVHALVLERLDELIRAAPRRNGGAVITPEMLIDLGWTTSEATLILRGLDFAPVGKVIEGETGVWRKRTTKLAKTDTLRPIQPNSPFAALASLTPPPASVKPALPRRRRRSRHRPQRAAAS